MYLRVPAFRDFNQQMRETMMKQSFKTAASDDEWFDDLVRWMEEAKGEKMPDDVREEIRQMYLDESYSLTWGKQHALSHLPQANDWSLTIQRMRWTLHEAPKHRLFLTSDNPFVMVSGLDPYQISGLRKPDVSLTFPLHRSLLLEATWNDDNSIIYVKASESLVTAFNRRTIRAATSFVFASHQSKPLDRIVQQHVDTAPRVEFSALRHPAGKGAYFYHRIVFGSPRR
jgi:Protein of unknown function (DUF4238)